MKPRLSVCLLPLFVLFVVGCSQNGSQETASSDPPVSAASDENVSVVPEDTKPSEPDIQNVSAEAVAENEQAPEQYRVKFETAKGNFVLEVTRRWAPHGADRFHQLVKSGFYDDCAFFRVVPNFVVQFGINGDPARQAKWRDARIPDDKVPRSNKKGMIVFATSGPNSRTSQVFINSRTTSFWIGWGSPRSGRLSRGWTWSTRSNESTARHRAKIKGVSRNAGTSS